MAFSKIHFPKIEGSYLPRWRQTKAFFFDLAIRVDYYAYKFFFQYVEHFSPFRLYESCEYLYWNIRERIVYRFGFRSKIQPIYLSLFEGITDRKKTQFQTLPYFEKVRQMFFSLQPGCNQKDMLSFFDLSWGACFGISLTAMKYPHYFDDKGGYNNSFTSDFIKDQVILIQSLHHLQAECEIFLNLQKKLQSHCLNRAQLLSKEGQIDPIKAFYYLRHVAKISGFLALYFADCKRLFSNSIEQLQEKITQCREMIAKSVVAGDTSKKLNPQVFSTEKISQAVAQEKIDLALSDFLCKNQGVFTLISNGKLGNGHAMFLKIEKQRCIVLDPARDILFTTAQTATEVKKIIELMKSLIFCCNCSGRVNYRMMKIDS